MTEKCSTLHPILHAATLLEKKLRLRLQPLDITPRQARILDALDKMGPLSQAKLGALFETKAASMSTMTTRMIANGLIQRTTDEADKRANSLEISERGRGLLGDIRIAWKDMDALIASILGPNEAKQHAHQANSLREALGGHKPQAKEKGNRTCS